MADAAPAGVAERHAGASARRRLGDALTVAGYRTGSVVARVVPRPVARALVPPVGLAAKLASAERRAIVERHLRRADPTLTGRRLRRAVQAAFESYVRYWAEGARLPSLSAEAVAAGFDVDGYGHVTAARERGNGVILALPHLGGWEWAGRWLADQGHPITVVVERIEPPELFDWFARVRAELGMRVIVLGAAAGRETLRALNRNEVVCLLSDRNIGAGGVEVEFFGERTLLPAGPATLARRTGAPILPVGVYFTNEPDGHYAIVRPPLPVERRGALRADVARITQHLATELEQLIRRAPEQWHLFQPNWPSDPGYGD